MANLKDTIVYGSLRATDSLLSTTLQFRILNLPTTSNGTTYGPGTESNIMVSNGTSVYWTNTVGNLTIGGLTDTDAGKTISSNSTLYLNSSTNDPIIFQRDDTDQILLDTANNFRPDMTNTNYLGTSTYRWKGLFLDAQTASNAEGIQFYSGSTLYARLGADTTTGGLGIYGSAHLWFKPSLSDATLGFEVDDTAVYPTTTLTHTLGTSSLLWTTIYSESIVSEYVNINTTEQTNYNLYIDGLTYFDGDVTHTSMIYFADDTTYYIDDNGTANLYGLTTNYDAIIKGSITINNAADEPIISFKGSNNTNAWGLFGMVRNTPGDGDLYSDHRFRFLNYSYDSNDNSYLSYYEYFDLPIVDANRTENANYFIITEKSFISGKSDYGEHNANNTILNGLYYYNSNGPSAQLGALSTDGGLYVQAYNSSWQGQIAQDYRDGSLYMRGKNNDTWTKWLQVMPVDLSSTKITNCNSVYKTGIYTNGGFTNRPSKVTDWGTLINYKLYESSNNYHRQIFLDCYGTDKIWTRSDNGGTWTDWKMLLNEVTGSARYHVGDTSSCTYVLVTINPETSWMLNFTLKVYQSYVATDIQISGYNYGSNHWYSPQARILGSTTTGAIKVYFGYTGNYKLWVAIDGASYTGADVVNVVNGYTQMAVEDAFTVTKVSSLPGTLQTTATCYRPWYRDESITAANADKGYVTGSSGTQYLVGVPAYSSTYQTHYIYSPVYMSSGNLYAYNITATSGLLKSTANSNTVTIGSQNSSWCHIYNSASIPFIFNQSVYTIGSILPYTSGSYNCGSSSYKWAHMYCSGRVYFDEWIQFSSATGLYWPNNNGAYLYANNVSSYGGLCTQGARGSYCGIHCGPSKNYLTLMSHETHQGLYNESRGRWIVYYDRSNDRMSLFTSSNGGYNCYCGGTFYATKVYNAVWNDYAECRNVATNEPGYCVTETLSGQMIKTTERLQAGCKITSDTYGTCMGETDQAKTPIAVAGRVLVYPYRDRNEYKLGAAVCSAPNGTVDIMTRDEIMMYPERIVGTVSEIPTYAIWNGGDEHKAYDIKVNGRIWIYVR